MIRIFVSCLIVIAPVAGMAQPAADPPIQLEADGTPLGDVLRMLSAQTGIDVVFAERTVRDRSVFGRYIGYDVEGALRTILRGSGLRAEQVRPRQYVIVQDVGFGVTVEQPLRGRMEGLVVDATDGGALPNAHVLLEGLGIGAVTNTAGYFALPGLPAGEYSVRISYIGYHAEYLTLTVLPPPEVARPEIRLSPRTHLTDQVLVESGDTGRSDLEIVPGAESIDVARADALPSVLGEGDGLSALEWFPGVSRASESGGELIVRGAEAQYNRYFLDGVPVIHPWHAFGLVSIFQTESLRSVRLHKGSFPAEYGGALSAILDVETRDGDRGRTAGTLAISPVSARGVAEIPVGNRLSLVLTGRRSWMGGILSPRIRIGSDGATALGFDPLLGDALSHPDENVDFFFHDIGLKATWRIANGHRLSFSVYDGGDLLEALSPVIGTSSEEESSSPVYDVSFRWGNRLASARYHGLAGSDFFLTGTAYVSEYNARDHRQADTALISSFSSDYQVRFTEIGFRADVDYYHSLQHQFRAGIHIIGRDFESSLHESRERLDVLLVEFERRDIVQAVELIGYIQDTWQPAAGWQLQPGLRVEYFALGNYLSINPRLHFRHTLLRDRLALRAGLSRQVQPLHRLRNGQSFDSEIAPERWIPAGGDVRPSSAWQAAFGVEWQPRRWLTVETEIFGRYLQSILQPVRSPESAGLILEEPGTGRAVGGEVSARFARSRWSGGISYGFSRSHERSASGGYRPARYDAPHQFEAYLSGNTRGWTWSVAGLIRSGYPYTRPYEGYSIIDPISGEVTFLHSPVIHNERLPAFVRLDVSLGYAVHAYGLDVEIRGEVHNLLNRENVVGMRHVRNVESVQQIEGAGLAQRPIVGLPMLPMVSLKLSW